MSALVGHDLVEALTYNAMGADGEHVIFSRRAKRIEVMPEFLDRVISSSRPEGWTEMKTTRKRYSAEFKAKVAMEAIRGELTLAELAAKHGIHHTMFGTWKRQAMDGMASLFDSGDQTAKAAIEAEIEKLHAKIGQLLVERDF